MKAIQISRENLVEVMLLPCVTMCYKTVSNHFRFKGTFESRAHYAKENDWLIQVSEKSWRAMSNAEYQRIKDKL